MPLSGGNAGTSRAAATPCKRVLILLGEVYADGGIQRFNRTFLTAGARLDIACEVLALNDSQASRTRWTAPDSINIRVYNRSKVRFALAIVAAMMSGRYSIVVVGHINLLPLVAAALLPKLLRKMRVLLIAHGIEVWTGIRGRRRRAIRKVDSILCVSRYTASMIHEQAPEMTDERFTVFPNALSESWTHQEQPATAGGVRHMLWQPFFLSVTRLDRNDRYKGIVTVLEAFAMLEDRATHYVIAGRGDDREFLEQVARRLGVANRVHFIGGVSDVELAALYRDCAVFVLPSGKEGFGIVFLEAMYFGAPVIAAGAKGVVDVVQHGKTGLLVPYGDTVSLRQAMDRLLTDTVLSDRIRAAASRTVRADGPFTFQAYVQRLAGILAVPARPEDTPTVSMGPTI
jgi:phosphatidyl-myo-inositol dimannoside synthase